MTVQSILWTMLIAYSVEHLNTAQCQEFSEEEIKAIIEEDESRGLYRLENKNEIKRFDGVDYEELKIFCHHGKLVQIDSRYMKFKCVRSFVYQVNFLILGQFLSLAGFWSATEMRLNIGSEYYNVYIANNVSMVQKMHKDHQVKRLNFLRNVSDSILSIVSSIIMQNIL